jgi:hypothetical protein
MQSPDDTRFGARAGLRPDAGMLRCVMR